MKRAWMALWILAGCSKPPDLIPLEVGTVWTYNVRSGFENFVEPVKVVRTVPVAGVDGVELAGALGTSRIGWRKDVLFCEVSSNAKFNPPIPIYAVDQKDRKWGGLLESMGKTQKCTGRLKHEKAKLQISGRSVSVTLTTMTITTPRTVIELKTWLQPGTGIVQQEQRTAGKLDVSIQLLDGPS
ncbi:MAG TPA: hypothetical protein VGE01_06815 [Fimbriimonas sp.]